MNLSRPLSLLAIALVSSCLAPSSVLAQKKPGVTYKYTLTDLLGFPDAGDYQSVGLFNPNRNVAGELLILGIPYPAGTINHPALWNIRADGTYPASNPVDWDATRGYDFRPDEAQSFEAKQPRAFKLQSSTNKPAGEPLAPTNAHRPGAAARGHGPRPGRSAFPLNQRTDAPTRFNP